MFMYIERFTVPVAFMMWYHFGLLMHASFFNFEKWIHEKVIHVVLLYYNADKKTCFFQKNILLKFENTNCILWILLIFFPRKMTDHWTIIGRMLKWQIINGSFSFARKWTKNIPYIFFYKKYSQGTSCALYIKHNLFILTYERVLFMELVFIFSLTIHF